MALRWNIGYYDRNDQVKDPEHPLVTRIISQKKDHIHGKTGEIHTSIKNLKFLSVAISITLMLNLPLWSVQKQIDRGEWLWTIINQL